MSEEEVPVWALVGVAGYLVDSVLDFGLDAFKGTNLPTWAEGDLIVADMLYRMAEQRDASVSRHKFAEWELFLRKAQDGGES